MCGVRELRRRLRLAGEARPDGLIVGELGRQNLDRDVALEPEVARAEDDGHPSAADLVLDPVLAAERGGGALAEGIDVGIGHGGRGLSDARRER